MYDEEIVRFMVSVIVKVYSNQKYLIRCLNSIKRQTYKDIEIIVMSEEAVGNIPADISARISLVQGMNEGDAIKTALDNAKGEGVVFVSSDSMMTDNVIQELLETSEELSVCSYTRVYTPDCTDYTLNKQSHISMCGKMYNKSQLLKVLNEKNIKDEVELTVEYLDQCKGLALAEETAIYEAEKTNMTENITQRDEDGWKKLLQLVSDKGMVADIRNYITAGIGEVVSETITDTDDIMDYAKEKFHNDVWLNYIVAKKSVINWWNQLQDVNNNKAYKKYIEYISSFEGESVAKLLLNDCGIDDSTFEVMRTNEQTVFLDVLCGVRAESGAKLAVGGIANMHLGSNGYTPEMTGVQLAEFVVDKYKTGKLGLKTIFKSMVAWIKYKI